MKSEIKTHKTSKPPGINAFALGLLGSFQNDFSRFSSIPAELGPLGSWEKGFFSLNSLPNLNSNHIKKSVRAKNNIKNYKKMRRFQVNTSHSSQVYNTFIQKNSKAPQEPIVLPYPDSYSRTMIGTNGFGKKLIFLTNFQPLIKKIQASNPTFSMLKSLIKDLKLMGTHCPHQNLNSNLLHGQVKAMAFRPSSDKNKSTGNVFKF